MLSVPDNKQRKTNYDYWVRKQQTWYYRIGDLCVVSQAERRIPHILLHGDGTDKFVCGRMSVGFAGQDLHGGLPEGTQPSLLAVSLSAKKVLHVLDAAKNECWVVMWCDVGPHYRNARFLAFWLVHLLKELGVPEASVEFFVEHHGKGIIDGHFGRMASWLDAIAKKKVVATLVDYCKFMGERAEMHHTENPMVPRCEFHAFTPPAKASLPPKVLDADWLRYRNMRIKSSYSWRSEMIGGEPMLHVRAMCGSEYFASARPVFLSAAALKKVDKATGPWKEYYRSSCPEKRELNIGSLSKCWAHMQALKPELTDRRQSHEERLASFRASVEHKRATQAAARQALQKRKAKAEGGASSGADSSDSSPASSSSSSSDSSSSSG